MKGFDHQRHNEKKKAQHSFMEKRALKHAKKLAKRIDVSAVTKLAESAIAH
ncbi:MAG: hypothetical protein JSS28_11970 [Proteobacteria bacterium]|nr:hypothetical protein [Pseudomonadota bacterium]